ncbi:TSC22 domain family protein 1 isoform X5 [Aptenodytes patagonicus]|uniref:TSC22 domain family protein 1 isoform X5 n=1 Tax=Aptenodytes patagonicus TaxID=9234 RepID=UPI003F9F2B8C
MSRGLMALAGMLSCPGAELGSGRLPDLVKSHLMYAVREEVEVLKEQIKELIEKNSQLEQENTLLKTLASPEQLAQFQAQLQTGSPPSSSQSQGTTQQPAQPASQGSGPSA